MAMSKVVRRSSRFPRAGTLVSVMADKHHVGCRLAWAVSAGLSTTKRSSQPSSSSVATRAAPPTCRVAMPIRAPVPPDRGHRLRGPPRRAATRRRRARLGHRTPLCSSPRAGPAPSAPPAHRGSRLASPSIVAADHPTDRLALRYGKSVGGDSPRPVGGDDRGLAVDQRAVAVRTAPAAAVRPGRQGKDGLSTQQLQGGIARAPPILTRKGRPSHGAHHQPENRRSAASGSPPRHSGSSRCLQHPPRWRSPRSAARHQSRQPKQRRHRRQPARRPDQDQDHHRNRKPPRPRARGSAGSRHWPTTACSIAPPPPTVAR